MNKLQLISNSSNLDQESFQVAAHDLNNLLNNVLSSIELLKESTSHDLNLLNLTKHIENNTLLASQIILKVTNSGKIQTEKSYFNLTELINDSIYLFTRGASNKIDISLETNNEIHTIFGNSIDLNRVFLNLFTNAVEACGSNSKIKISIEEQGSGDIDDPRYVKVTVADNGRGIPDKILDKIYEKGFSTKIENSQNGLGLSIIKEIIDLHDGHIEASSKMNEGTTFEIFLPANRAIFDIKNLENKKIIIAEDDKFQREVLKDLLVSMKLNVYTASSGEEALDLFVSAKPDLVFIDEKMPGMTGLQCTEKIRNIDESSQIVLVTGSQLDKNLTDGKVTRVIKKPYNFETLKSTLGDLL